MLADDLPPAFYASQCERPAANPKALRAIADGKDPLDYLEPALEGPLSRVMEHGALKYGYRNYTAADICVRTSALAAGQDTDPDSGHSHWAHIAACCAVVLGAEQAGSLRDDRAAAVVAHSASTVVRPAARVDAACNGACVGPAQRCTC
jgi:hypothetical protein